MSSPGRAFTPEAARYAMELTGRAPRHRSHDVHAWLGGICERIEKREFTGDEYIALNEIHDAAKSLMVVAEERSERRTTKRRCRVQSQELEGDESS